MYFLVSILLAQASDPNPYTEVSSLDSKYFNPDYLFAKEVEFFKHLFTPPFSSSVVDIFHGVLVFLAIFFITIICYTTVRMFEIRKKEHDHLHHEIAEYAHNQSLREKKMQEREGVSSNVRWVKTLDYLFSQHASDWKLAVIEADSMLLELMEQLGFKGDNLGEKLKGATQETFRGLTRAWEVHTIRNKIAHEGLGFEISHHEAKRVIAIYEQIFREFGFV